MEVTWATSVLEHSFLNQEPAILLRATTPLACAPEWISEQ